MRSEAQRIASQINGAKSKGPTSPEGKAVSKFNGLKHGLRAEEMVLPGEDPAAFEAELKGWFDDWRPMTHTRAVLVERAAAAAWRLRRSARAEAARLAKAADDAARNFDLDRLDRVDRAVNRLDEDPVAAVALLGLDATGLDRLIRSWRELARALGHGPAGWTGPIVHARLMLLLGRRPELGPVAVGPAAIASARLAAANDPGSAETMPEAEALAAVATLRQLIARELRDLRARRREAEDPDSCRRRAVESASAEAVATKEEQLRHRYEMAHERSLRESLRLLLALQRTGADLPEAEVVAPESVSNNEVAPSVPRESCPSVPSCSGSLGAAGRVPSPSARPAPRRRRQPSNRPDSGGGGGRLSR